MRMDRGYAQCLRKDMYIFGRIGKTKGEDNLTANWQQGLRALWLFFSLDFLFSLNFMMIFPVFLFDCDAKVYTVVKVGIRNECACLQHTAFIKLLKNKFKGYSGCLYPVRHATSIRWVDFRILPPFKWWLTSESNLNSRIEVWNSSSKVFLYFKSYFQLLEILTMLLVIIILRKSMRLKI